MVKNKPTDEESMTPTLEVLTPDQINERRAELLASTRMSMEELQARARIYALTPQEQGVLDLVRDLEYLGETA